ncbi:hypothetical protein MTR67_038442 [Solanum verrucosum]|uniref:Transposase MuDR plant domain-containing protein n=1 Tax=Solanum verrucosum TaxID=315347 RepID=A0AAF0UFH6_SOLVR|nr:hypothetical protein MTR67_038442 [Solanum verrucosum]
MSLSEGGKGKSGGERRELSGGWARLLDGVCWWSVRFLKVPNRDHLGEAKNYIDILVGPLSQKISSILTLLQNPKGEESLLKKWAKKQNEPLLDTEGPRGYLTNVGGEGVDVDLGEGGKVVNLGGEGEVVDLSGEGEAVNLGGEGVDDNLGGEGVDDNLGGEGEYDFLSSDSDLDIPSEDGSDIDEELRAFRQEKRNKKQRKKATEFEEIPVGEAGGIDRGFQDIGKNKTDKYAGKLGGDEDYIDSSDCWSDDSGEQLDVDVVRGVDIPARMRSKKVRYDEDCEVSIFELGMVFEGVNQFRKAVADYVVEYRRQIKLRPTEKHRVRVKCKNANCKWLLYASIDRDSGDFIVKNYHPVHKCIPLNRNKLCNSKLIARKFKDRIVSQPHIRIWEIQDLVRKTLGLYCNTLYPKIDQIADFWCCRWHSRAPSMDHSRTHDPSCRSVVRVSNSPRTQLEIRLSVDPRPDLRSVGQVTDRGSCP